MISNKKRRLAILTGGGDCPGINAVIRAVTKKAILEYDNVTKKFPNSNKVPHALLKQGFSFLSLGDKASARLLLQQVIKDYPNTNQAKTARAKLQQIK